MLTKSLVLLFAVAAVSYPGNDIQLAGIKCIINGENNASEKWTASHLDGEVFFSNYGGIATFNAAPDVYAMKANHQLVLTGQYSQTACPCCGTAISQCDSGENEGSIDKVAAPELTVAGVSIVFCSDECLESVERESEITAKAEIVFSDEPFQKAFSKRVDSEDGETGK